MIYFAVQLAALARLFWIRYPYPWFLAALVWHAAQALNVQYATASPDWVRTHWIAPEVLLVLATAGATVEAIERYRGAVPEYLRFQLRVAAALIPVSLVGFGIRFLAPISHDLEAGFNGLRSWVWVFLALALLVAQGLLWARPGVCVPSTIWTHGALLLVVLLVHATVSWFVGESEEVKRELREYSRLVIGGCCVLWATNKRKGGWPANFVPSGR